jgi:hypothetical protein
MDLPATLESIAGLVLVLFGAELLVRGSSKLAIPSAFFSPNGGHVSETVLQGDLILMLAASGAYLLRLDSLAGSPRLV